MSLGCECNFPGNVSSGRGNCRLPMIHGDKQSSQSKHPQGIRKLPLYKTSKQKQTSPDPSSPKTDQVFLLSLSLPNFLKEGPARQ